MENSTKSRILDEALIMFAENGYKGTNLRDLAARLGLSKSALYKHYASKEDIWNSLLDRMEAYYAGRFGSESNLPPSPESCDELLALTMQMLHFTVNDPKIILTRKLLLTEQFHDERVKLLATKHFLTGTQTIFAKIFEKMMSDGILKKDNPQMLSFIYTAPVTSLVHLCDREPENQEQILKQAETFIQHFIAAYAEKKNVKEKIMNHDVYMHGQILGTHSFLLKGDFVKPDEYSEIKAKYFLPGGETGTAATVLASFGVNVKIDGTHIGTAVAPLLKDFYKDTTVDLSSLYFDPDYEGLMDYVIISGLVRSPMGVFQSLYEPGAKKRWSIPEESDIAGCRIAAIDPFFLEETQHAAELCVKHQKPYVTIDCRHNSYLHQHCAVNVVSKECTSSEEYKDKSLEEIYRLLTGSTDGLVIITRGEKEMLYGRKNQPMKKMKPFKVDVKSTLGAGDTFKAGCIYGLLNNMTDDELVRFASACSAIAISRFPLPLNPPALDEVKKLIDERQL